MLELYEPQMTIWQAWVVLRITKATNTISEYVIILDFTLQKQLRQRAPMLRSYVSFPPFYSVRN